MLVILTNQTKMAVGRLLDNDGNKSWPFRFARHHDLVTGVIINAS